MHPTEAALIVAHPGHELRLHGWLESARPRTYVLTDGSGRAGRGRLSSTERVLRGAGAAAGEVFGRFTDAGLYAALLRGEHGRFLALAAELAASWQSNAIRLVVSDAAEGYNPAHDVCRLVVDLAVALAARRGHFVASYDFAVVGRPWPAVPPAGAVCVRLGTAALARKLASASTYAELAGEVASALAAHGAAAFAAEWLRPVAPEAAPPAPAYERFGGQRVASGHYHQVVTYDAHVRPLACALARAAAEGVPWAA